MKKVLKAFLITLLALAALTSCSKKAENTATAATTEKAASTVVSKAAAAYPNKGVTVICPWGAGGGTDAILRAVCGTAEKYLGTTLTVENKTGGAGAIGHAAIKNAKADGYTIGMITFELNSLPQQGLIDFTYADYDPICLVNRDAAALTVNAKAPYNTIDEFVAYCKANPGKVTIGNSAPGSVWHIGAGLLANETGIEVKHVAFEGAATAVTQLAGGHIDAVAVSLAEVKSQLDAGNVKVLGVMDTDRPAAYPEIKTFKEQGYDIQYYTWRGIAVPKGTDPVISAKIEDAFAKACADPDFLAQAKNLNQNIVYMDSAEFGQFLKDNFDAVTKTLNETHLLDE